jgi:hypothetical protein
LDRHSIHRLGVLTLFVATIACSTAGHAAPCEAPQPIRFAVGAFAATVSGGIARGEIACRTISARLGQHMSVHVSSVEDNTVVQIYRPGWTIIRKDSGFEINGVALAGLAEGSDARSWAGHLPKSGTYLVVLGTTRGGANYQLHVEIK